MKILDYWVKFLLFLLLLSLPTSIALMEGALALLSLTGLSVYIVQSLKKKKLESLALTHFKWIDFGFCSFLAVIGLTTILNTNISFEYKITVLGEQRWIFFLYFLIYLLRSQKIQITGLQIKFLISLFVLVSLYSILQAFTGIEWINDKPMESQEMLVGDRTFWRTAGIYGNIMSFTYITAFYLSMLGGYLLGGLKQRTGSVFNFIGQNKAAIASFIIVFVAFFLTQTRGGWLAFFVASSVTFSVLYKKYIIHAVMSFLLISVLLYNTVPIVKSRVDATLAKKEKSESSRERYNLMVANWEMFKDQPFVGVGYRYNQQMTKDYYEKLGIKSEFYSHAHNVYLQILAGNGIFALLAYLFTQLALLMWTIREYLRSKKVIALGLLAVQIVFWVGALTENVLMDGEIIFNYIFVIIAALLALSNKEHSKNVPI